MEVKGYKAFNKDKTNRCNELFDVGVKYRVTGDIRFGGVNTKVANGYHMCTRLADVFRYVDAMNGNFIVAEVTGRGNYQKYDDEYYGYFDMYAFEEIEINRFIDRKEVMEILFSTSGEFDVSKLVRTCRLTPEELLVLINKFKSCYSLLKLILYYQLGQTDIYRSTASMNVYDLCLRKVRSYGQNNS